MKWNPTDDLHLSLSRTVAIPHHFINPFVESLQSEFIDFNGFYINFSAADLQFYVNDEQTRSFLGFGISSMEQKRILNKLVKKVDEVFSDFRYPKFYEEALYHFSIAWCLGNVTRNMKCDQALKYFQESWSQIEVVEDHLFSFQVTEISLKCGNKTFNFQLK